MPPAIVELFGNLLGSALWEKYGIVGLVIVAVLYWSWSRRATIKTARSRQKQFSTKDLAYFIAMALALGYYLRMGTLYIANSFNQAVSRIIDEEHKKEITTDNIESKVRDWANHFHFSIKEEHLNDSRFGYTLSALNGNKYVVVRLKEYDNYLTIMRGVILPKLPADQSNRVMLRLFTELAKMNTVYVIKSQTIFLQKRLAITSSLSEDVFLNAIQQLESSETVVSIFLASGLDSSTSETKRKD